MIIRSLDAADAAAYQELRLRALRNSPAAFSASYDDEAGRSIAEITARVTPVDDGSLCVFGAFAEATLVGIVAFIRPQRAKLSHCADLAGMYTAPEHRRRGIGRLLMNAVIAHACGLVGVRQLRVSVNQTNKVARNLYVSAGFQGFGVEPEALYVDGVYYDEEHFILRLAETAENAAAKI